MIVELLHTTTTDGLRLHGALHRATAERDLAVQALLCLHGVGSNFYGSALFSAITSSISAAGVSVLWANTRGHDAVYTAAFPAGARRQGAAYEVVADCVLDIAAWIQALQSSGFERVGVLGHSLGALKALYREAHQPHPPAACVIAVSPPRLSCSAFHEDPRSASFVECLGRAQNFVDRGSPEELIEVSFPLPMLITAEGFLDKYGPQEKYNLVKFAQHVRAPLLCTYGGRELEQGGVAFAGVPEALRDLPSEGQQFEVEIIHGADHQYNAQRAQLANVILKWLER